MDIERLRNKRHLNVQEQVLLRKHSVLKGAKYWRENESAVPDEIKKILIEKKIDINKSIFIDYSRNSPGCYTDDGIILDQNKRFFEFQIDVVENQIQDIIWDDITKNLDLSHKKAGSGPTRFYLALEVQEELNREGLEYF